ncbi:hypothetical protein [Phaeobacter sp. JH20_02]|uniref:hypothetical protein n=1 Tax=Phaeobacter sp. JH20_02 TaxID=3112461 RepID=UPI003A874FE4
MPKLDIIKLIERIASDTGLKETTIGLRACGDAMVYERTKRRKKQDETRLQKLRDYHAAVLSQREGKWPSPSPDIDV